MSFRTERRSSEKVPGGGCRRNWLRFHCLGYFVHHAPGSVIVLARVVSAVIVDFTLILPISSAFRFTPASVTSPFCQWHLLRRCHERDRKPGSILVHADHHAVVV